jgi:hypothetical protein
VQDMTGRRFCDVSEYEYVHLRYVLYCGMSVGQLKSQTPPKNPAEEIATTCSPNSHGRGVYGTGKRACFRVAWAPPSAVVVAARAHPASA